MRFSKLLVEVVNLHQYRGISETPGIDLYIVVNSIRTPNKLVASRNSRYIEYRFSTKYWAAEILHQKAEKGIFMSNIMLNVEACNKNLKYYPDIWIAKE